jgi:hypothetical protein
MTDYTTTEFRVNEKIWRLTVGKGEMRFEHLRIGQGGQELIRRSERYAESELMRVEEVRTTREHTWNHNRYIQLEIMVTDMLWKEHVLFRDFLGIDASRTPADDVVMEKGVATIVAAIRRLIDGAD